MTAFRKTVEVADTVSLCKPLSVTVDHLRFYIEYHPTNFSTLLLALILIPLLALKLP